jgi:hypothetical protein
MYSSYLNKILANHVWSEEGKKEARHFKPLHPSYIKELETSEGPGDPVAAKTVETAASFAYRTGIGEIIFAYVTCRLDIGYAVTELSKFSTKPAAVHYTALKRVFRYLRQTREQNLVYCAYACPSHMFRSSSFTPWTRRTKYLHTPTFPPHCVPTSTRHMPTVCAPDVPLSPLSFSSPALPWLTASQLYVAAPQRRSSSLLSQPQT